MVEDGVIREISYIMFIYSKHNGFEAIFVLSHLLCWVLAIESVIKRNY